MNFKLGIPSHNQGSTLQLSYEENFARFELREL